MIISRFAMSPLSLIEQLPVNTLEPFIEGTQESLQEVTVNDGLWRSYTEKSFTYQWQLDGVDIVGATAKTLLILVGMIGKSLRCIVKCTNSKGFRLKATVAITVLV